MESTSGLIPYAFGVVLAVALGARRWLRFRRVRRERESRYGNTSAPFAKVHAAMAHVDSSAHV